MKTPEERLDDIERVVRKRARDDRDALVDHAAEVVRVHPRAGVAAGAAVGCLAAWVTSRGGRSSGSSRSGGGALVGALRFALTTAIAAAARSSDGDGTSLPSES